MIQKLKVIFADFLHALRRLWLEMIGGVFLAFGILFTLSAFREYRKYASSPDEGIFNFGLTTFFSALMFLFALESFWKARKPHE